MSHRWRFTTSSIRDGEAGEVAWIKVWDEGFDGLALYSCGEIDMFVAELRALAASVWPEAENVGPFDPDELVRWATLYGHPEEWAKRAQQAHARAEKAERRLRALHNG